MLMTSRMWSLMKAVQLAAATVEVTFHRAIDRSADPLRALEMLLLLGVQRVLTSGAADRAVDGTQALRAMVERAGNKVAIAAAGGIRGHNVVEVVERTGVKEIHFSAQRSTSWKYPGHGCRCGTG